MLALLSHRSSAYSHRIARAPQTPHHFCQLRHGERRRLCRWWHRRRSGERRKRRSCSIFRSDGGRRRRSRPAHVGERAPHYGVLRDVCGSYHATRALMISGCLLFVLPLSTRTGETQSAIIKKSRKYSYMFRRHEIIKIIYIHLAWQGNINPVKLKLILHI